mmetsp:Transcript_8601/g.20704  ORF Transcript_8601/g.20704 Transcript_8601/m.20704 type:complete len:100 (-) Transcript_8601:147-446(-)|eukprot:CAMPEP_0113604854 /NCGR_PEP_ID=MMETSP0017_2-20120614/2014_1 /TAXON_ID=2856 /ORGANISM="Cylindrotheca closterium" /LENGTH=99 /DNA_ID=CAMNT_0000513301 /DNA_START=1258 /DNA_END=1557 /DNA_ORIENTATION=+ /assembly_acc=CAM_ASM_000147
MQLNNKEMEVEDIDFAALSLSTTTHKQSDGLCQGWGSEETRKGYVCLEKLGNDDAPNEKVAPINAYAVLPASSAPHIYHTQSSFCADEADGMDCDENFW